MAGLEKIFLVHKPSFKSRTKCIEAWSAVDKDDCFDKCGLQIEKLCLVRKNPGSKFIFPYMNWISSKIGDAPALIVIISGTKKQISSMHPPDDYMIIARAVPNPKTKRYNFK